MIAVKRRYLSRYFFSYEVTNGEAFWSIISGLFDTFCIGAGNTGELGMEFSGYEHVQSEMSDVLVMQRYPGTAMSPA